MTIKFNKKAWNALVTDVIDNVAVPRMQRVADASNATLEEGEGYMVSTEGDDPLDKRSYRATVITTTPEAMRSNAKNNTLVKNAYLAGGD
jgi:hypothetical protein